MPVCAAARVRHLTAHILAAEDVAQDTVAVVNGVGMGQCAAVIDVALMLAAAQGSNKTVKSLLAGHVVLESRGECRDQRAQRRGDLALVQSKLLPELLSGAPTLRIEDGFEDVQGPSFKTPIQSGCNAEPAVARVRTLQPGLASRL